MPEALERVDLGSPAIPNSHGTTPSGFDHLAIATGGEQSYLFRLFEMVILRFGLGKLSPSEYLDLKLYDRKLYTMADKRALPPGWYPASPPAVTRRG